MYTVVKIGMGNAAFDEDPTGEVARILRELAERIDGHPHFSPDHEQTLTDSNGNAVGQCTVMEGYHQIVFCDDGIYRI